MLHRTPDPLVSEPWVDAQDIVRVDNELLSTQLAGNDGWEIV